MITSLEKLSLFGVVPKLEDSQLRYEFEELQTGITQKNVMAFKTINGEHLKGEFIPVSICILVGDEVVESTDAKTTIRAVGNLAVAKVVKDVDGKGEFATPKKSSSITWQLRISSDKYEEAQLFIDPDSEIVLVDKLPKFVEYVSDSHGGTYDAKAHTVTWVFDAPSLEAQHDAEGYLFLETIDLETQVTGITSNKYFENITNSAEGQLTQIDKTVLKRTANATTTITGTESVIPPADGNWIRGNFRGPSDGKNGIAPVADPQLDITLDESAKINFGSGYYIHHGTGTTVYVGNQKLVSPSNTERKKHGIGFEQIIEKGYQYVDMVYDVGDGLLLEAIRIRKPRLYAKKASDQDFLPSNLPIAIIELNTVDGKKFNHQVDFRAYTDNFKTFDVLDITGGENVEVRDFRIKFIPNETQSVLDGNFAATFVEMRYRVKPGTEGIIENKYHAEFKVNGNNELIKYVGEKNESQISSRSVTIKKDPKGTPPITEVRRRLIMSCPMSVMYQMSV